MHINANVLIRCSYTDYMVGMYTVGIVTMVWLPNKTIKYLPNTIVNGLLLLM